MQTFEQLQEGAPILQKIVDLYKEFYAALKGLPKKDQYLLGKRAEDTLLLFLEYIIAAANASKDKKLQFLIHANSKCDLLKILLRLAYELKILDTKKYISLQEKIQEIGKMLGGWLRSLTTKIPV